MKKNLLIILSLICSSSIFAQERIIIHKNDETTISTLVSNVDSIKFNQDATNTIFNLTDTIWEIAINSIDSITFADSSNTVFITYNGNSASVINPLSGSGVSVTISESDVTVHSTGGIQDIEYYLSGTTTEGSLYIYSDKRFTISMNGVSISNSDGPAIYSAIDQKMTVNLIGGTVSNLIDGSSSLFKAAFQSEGQMIFTGNGTLNVTGNKKHAINSDDYIRIVNGTINIINANTDGIHADYFIMDGGSLIINSEGDGIDGDEGFIQINGGQIGVTCATSDTKAISCDSTLTVNGGTINISISGAQSKGLKSGKTMTFNGGYITATISGIAVLTASGSGYDPSYCTAIKGDADIVINGGDISITSTSSANGGKGISADGNIAVNGGIISITTAGNGGVYTNTSGTTDSYTAACIKSDADISLLGGHITCISTGTGGKCISAESTMTIGLLNAENDSLTINVTTSGARFLVTSGSGPDGGDYANPKAIKSEGNMTINSGTIIVLCTQTTEGGEGIESKATITINGGKIEVQAYDDCINATSNITINGGTIYCYSKGNDAIDSNGSLNITGGLTIGCGSRTPEEAFDCDQNTFAITGGILIGTSGATSNPTSSACTQHSIKYNGTATNAISIVNSSNNTILTYQMPSFYGSGGGGPGGGNSMLLLYTSPSLTTGTYTLKYGGTISGGTNFHGLYTNASYSGGSSRTFTISTSMLTTIN